MVVSTCSATSASTSTERLRCSPAVTTRGRPGEANLAVPAIPRITVTVSSTSATTPNARVAYQNGLAPVLAALSAIGVIVTGVIVAVPRREPTVPGDRPSFRNRQRTPVAARTWSPAAGAGGSDAWAGAYAPAESGRRANRSE